MGCEKPRCRVAQRGAKEIAALVRNLGENPVDIYRDWSGMVQIRGKSIKDLAPYLRQVAAYPNAVRARAKTGFDSPLWAGR
jgi:hypothetical protein